MTAPSTIVATLARMLEVLHTDSSDRDLLKSAFRDLYAAVEPSGATISIDVKGMIIDGTPLPHGLPGGSEVRIRFHTHGIGTVRLPAGVKPADLLVLALMALGLGLAGVIASGLMLGQNSDWFTLGVSVAGLGAGLLADPSGLGGVAVRAARQA